MSIVAKKDLQRSNTSVFDYTWFNTKIDNWHLKGSKDILDLERLFIFKTNILTALDFFHEIFYKNNIIGYHYILNNKHKFEKNYQSFKGVPSIYAKYIVNQYCVQSDMSEIMTDSHRAEQNYMLTHLLDNGKHILIELFKSGVFICNKNDIKDGICELFEFDKDVKYSSIIDFYLILFKKVKNVLKKLCDTNLFKYAKENGGICRINIEEYLIEVEERLNKEILSLECIETLVDNYITDCIMLYYESNFNTLFEYLFGSNSENRFIIKISKDRTITCKYNFDPDWKNKVSKKNQKREIDKNSVYYYYRDDSEDSCSNKKKSNNKTETKS